MMEQVYSWCLFPLVTSLCAVGSTDCRTEEVESALAAENSRLHEELDRIRKQPFPVIAAQVRPRSQSSNTGLTSAQHQDSMSTRVYDNILILSYILYMYIMYPSDKRGNTTQGETEFTK